MTKPNLRRPILPKLDLPNWADLRRPAWSALGGDPCDTLGLRHGGSPYRYDVYGSRKIDTHQAALKGDLAYFEKIARVFSSPSTRNDWTQSQRVIKWKDGKKRPLDLPPEGKRLFAQFREHQLQAIVRKNGGLLPTIVGFRTLKEFPIYEARAKKRKGNPEALALDEKPLTDEEAKQDRRRKKRQRRRRKAKDGYTIQDVFAGTVYLLVDEAGVFVVVVDLQDAFGRLPHRAIHEALLEQGLGRADRREILDLVRINSVEKNGKPVTCGSNGNPNEGIEQGNPLSPMIFNLVMDLVFRRLQGNDSLLRAASYGDDLILVAATEAEAKALFERLYKIMTALGFTNIRPLGGTDAKASKIYDTTVNPVPLIKIYTVGPKGITLTAKAEARVIREYLKLESDKRSRNALQKICPYKVITKRSMEEVPGGFPGSKSSLDLERKLRVGGGVEGQGASHIDLPSTRVEATVSIAMGIGTPVPTPREMEVDGTLIPFRSMKASASMSMEKDEEVPTSTPGDGVPTDGFGEYLVEGDRPLLESGPCASDSTDVRLYDTDVSSFFETNSNPTRKGSGSTDPAWEQGTTCSGGGGVSAMGSSPSKPVSTIMSLAREHRADLAAGRRVRTGHKGSAYNEYILDVRCLSELPASRVSFGLQQCVRLASLHGRARLLVDPTAPWVLDADLLRDPQVPGWKLMRLEDRQGGLVVTLRKNAPQEARRRRPAPAPTADLVLRRTRIDPGCRVVVHLWATRDGTPLRWTVEVESFTDRDAIRSALGIVIEEENPRTVAIPNLRGLGLELVPDPSRPKDRHRSIPLAQAMAILSRWDWVQHGDWLVGTGQEERRDRDAGSVAGRLTSVIAV